jgi:hypothetical protein
VVTKIVTEDKVKCAVEGFDSFDTYRIDQPSLFLFQDIGEANGPIHKNWANQIEPTTCLSYHAYQRAKFRLYMP